MTFADKKGRSCSLATADGNPGYSCQEDEELRQPLHGLVSIYNHIDQIVVGELAESNTHSRKVGTLLQALYNTVSLGTLLKEMLVGTEGSDARVH
jgi:hypothetical protein